MRQNGVRGGQGERSRIPTARDRGWDDSLYEDRDRERNEGGDTRDGDGEPHERGPVKRDRDRQGEDKHSARRRPARRRRRVLLWIVSAFSVLVLLVAGAGYFYYQYLNGNLGKDILNLGDSKLDKTGPNAAGQTPLNILLLGSDSRDGGDNAKLGGSRADRGRPPLADVQMMLHVSADRSNMSVISIPRDTKATIPKCTDPDDGKVYPETTGRINSSLQRGGPGCTVATWEELTGIPVDHFMMIDFSGVVSMADAVGGVPVCVKDNVRDPKSHLRLRKGRSVVRGEQALHWLRTRHGFGDGTDIGRAKAQHMYMNSMVRQLKSGTKLTDPGKLRDLAEAATEALTVDTGIGSVKKLYDLGSDLRRVPTGRITMTTMPWRYAPGGYVEPKDGDADKLFSMVRNDVALDGKDKKKHGPAKKPEPTKPSTPQAELPVRVLNGTGTALQAPVTGRAGQITEVLGRQGFAQTVADATPKSQADTTVSYPREGQRGDALAVAKSLGLPESSLKHSTGVDEVTLVIGADWRQGERYPAGAGGGSQDDADKGGSGGKDDNKAPDSADALNGKDKGACMDVNPAYRF